MDLLKRVLDIGKAVVAVRYRVIEEFVRQPLKLPEHLLKPFVLDGVITLPSRGYRCEAYFPKTNILRQMPEDPFDIQVLTGQGDPCPDRSAGVPP